MENYNSDYTPPDLNARNSNPTPDSSNNAKPNSAMDNIISDGCIEEINSIHGSSSNDITADEINSTPVQSVANVNLSESNTILRNIANTDQFMALDGDNAVNFEIHVASEKDLSEKSSDKTISSKYLVPFNSS